MFAGIFGIYPHTRKLDVRNILFTQDSISGAFSDGGSVEQTIQDIKSGKVSISDLPKVRVVELKEGYVSLDNRRCVATRG